MAQLRRAREELDTLKKELEDQRVLARRLQQAEHAATVAEERAARAEASAGAVDRVVYVSREKKIPKLRGRPRDQQDVDVTDWLEDIKSSISARRMSPDEQVDFIMQHLVGEAKSEMRLRFRGERDVTRLLDAIEESYGYVDSATSLKKEFFRRDQGEKESFEDYSLALVKVADRIVQRDNREDESINKELKERLTEGVVDNHFRRELRRLNMDEPELTFWSFRARAMKWLGDDNSGKARNATVHEVSHTPTTSTLEEKMGKQQAQIDAIEKKLDLLLCTPKKHTKRNNSGRNENGIRVCYGCGSPDHMIRECPAKKLANQQKRGRQPQMQEHPSSKTQVGN